MNDTADLVIRFIAYDLASNIAFAVGDAIEGLAGRMMAHTGTMARGLQDVGLQMLQVGAIAGTLGLMVVGGMIWAAKGAADFESQLVLLHTQAGLTGDATATLDQKMQGFRQGILQMAPGVGFGPTDLAKGLYQFVSAATPGVNQLDALHAAAVGAAVGHAQLETTAFNLSHVLAAYPSLLPIDAMGILNAIVGAGTMRMDDLNAAFRNGILATAQLSGISLPQLGGALATMTDLGIPAANSATYLRQALSAIIAPTKQAQTILAGVGLTGDEVKTSIAGMSGMLQKAGITQSQLGKDLREGGLIMAFDDLRTHLTDAGLTAQEQADVIIRAFGGARMGTAMAVLYENEARLQQKTDQVTRGQHDLAAAFDYMVAHDPDFALKVLQSTFETLRVALGEAFIPVLAQLARAFAPILLAITDWVINHEELTARIVEGVAVGLLLFGALNLIGGAFVFVTGTVMRFIAPINLATGAAGGLVGAAGRLTAGLGGLGRAFLVNLAGVPALLGSIGRLLLALGAGTGLLAGRLAANLLGLPALFMALVRLLAAMGSALAWAVQGAGIFRVALNALPMLLGVLRGGLVALATGGFGALRAAVVGLVPLLAGGLAALAEVIFPVVLVVGLLIAAGVGLYMAFQKVGPALREFQMVLRATRDPAVALRDALMQIGIPTDVAMKAESTFRAMQTAVETFQKVLRATGSPLIAIRDALMSLGVPATVFGTALRLVQVVINGVTGVLRQFWTELMKNIGQIHGAGDAIQSLQRAWAVLGPVLLVVAGIIMALIGGAFKALFQTLAVIIPAAIQIVIDIIQIVAGVIQVLGSIVVGVVKIVNDVIHGDWSQAWKDAQQMVQGVADGLGTILHGLVNLVVDLFLGLWHSVVALVGGLVSGVIDAAWRLYNSLVGGSIIPDMINGIISWFGRLPGEILGILGGLIGSAANSAWQIGSAIFNGIMGALGGLGGAIASHIGGAVSGAISAAQSAAHGAGIPGFAAGGLVMGPTLAMVGEEGPELIVPLSAISGGSAAAGLAPALVGPATPPGGDQEQSNSVLQAIYAVLTEIRDQQQGQRPQSGAWRDEGTAADRPPLTGSTSSALQQLAALLYDLTAKGSMARNQLGLRAQRSY